MKKKYFRKIIVSDKEYDWLYRDCYYNAYVYLYDVYYQYHKEKDILEEKKIRKIR